MLGEPRLSRDHAEAVIARALEIDAADEGLTVGQLLEVGRDLGISRSALERSLVMAEAVRRTGDEGLLARVLGPSGVIVERWTARSVHGAAADLERRLERFHLTRLDGAGREWVQRNDWWPDARRISAPIALEVEAVPSSVTTLLRVRASFAEARRNHVAGALVGAAALPLALLGIPVALLVAGCVGAAVGAVASFRMRVRGVERRLARVLDAVAVPPA